MNYTTKRIRNVALIGHSGEGKTSLAEAMLYNAGKIDRLGKIDDGTTVMDYDQEEIQRRLSINLSLASAPWQDNKINIIDVPGFFDFEGELKSAYCAMDAVIVVTGASGHVTVGAEKVIDKAMKYKTPGIIFISQINKENADYQGTVDALVEKYPQKIAVVEIPIIDDNGKMTGAIQVLKKNAVDFDGNEIPIPEKLMPAFEKAYTELAEIAAESTDEMMEKYFSGEPLTRDEIIEGIKDRATHDGILLLMAGSSTANRGVINLMNKVVDMVPNPTECIQRKDVDGNEIICDSDGPLVAQVFKNIADPFVGNLSYVRVIRGTLKQGTTVINSRTGKQEKISNIYVMKGKNQEPVTELVAGDIGALAKLQDTATSDTLCDEGNVVTMPRFSFPKANYFMAIRPVKRGEEEKVAQGLQKIMEEDKTLVLEKNTETKETLLGGLGDTQLNIVLQKLKNKYKVEAELFDPKIAYRETIKKQVEARGKHKKQSGGHGQYGDCVIRFEPYPEGDFAFDEEVVGGAVPKQYIPAVEKGLRECIEKGILTGSPVVNLKAVLTDGSYHDVDSSEMAFKIAASLAFKEGMQNANPVLLEPVMSVKIVVPEDYVGDILGDLNKRRGRVLGLETEDDKQIVNAEAPHAEMFKYATDLRSMTQGRGEFTMEFARYEEVPPMSAEKIIAEAKKNMEE